MNTEREDRYRELAKSLLEKLYVKDPRFAT